MTPEPLTEEKMVDLASRICGELNDDEREITIPVIVDMIEEIQSSGVEWLKVEINEKKSYQFNTRELLEKVDEAFPHLKPNSQEGENGSKPICTDEQNGIKQEKAANEAMKYLINNSTTARLIDHLAKKENCFCNEKGCFVIIKDSANKCRPHQLDAEEAQRHYPYIARGLIFGSFLSDYRTKKVEEPKIRSVYWWPDTKKEEAHNKRVRGY